LLLNAVPKALGRRNASFRTHHSERIIPNEESIGCVHRGRSEGRLDPCRIPGLSHSYPPGLIPMSSRADVIVVGLGAVGSAAAYHLSRHGARVLGLDRYAPPHRNGSSHGGSRIIRKTYGEGATYLPLLQRAYHLWEALEATTDETLWTRTGGVDIGPPDSPSVRGPLAAAQRFDLAHALLSPAEAKRRFPMFRVPSHHVVFWDPEAGILHPEACIRAHAQQARRHGATLRHNEPVHQWQSTAAGVQVATDTRTYRARWLVVCAGGWTGSLVPDLELPLTIERQVNGWFQPPAEASLGPSVCPVFRAVGAAGCVLYGVPDLGSGVKVGVHHEGQRVTHPRDLRRAVQPADVARLREHLPRLMPATAGAAVTAETCFYTNTPSHRFVIDKHPRAPVVVASACSGHGFKMAAAVGEALAHLVLGVPPAVDLGPFRRSRHP
jgi:sarcosine oxidase